jgi:hypothetical protein
MSGNTVRLGSPLVWLSGATAASPKPGPEVASRPSGRRAEVRADAERDAALDGVDGQPGAPLSQQAFRHLLAIERARAGRTGRPLRLLTVSFNHGTGRPPIRPVIAAKVFEGLGEAVRDTDIVGWYRQDRVAAAVLIERAGSSQDEASLGVADRVVRALEARLSSRVARQFQVQVVRLRRQPQDR